MLDRARDAGQRRNTTRSACRRHPWVEAMLRVAPSDAVRSRKRGGDRWTSQVAGDDHSPPMTWPIAEPATVPERAHTAPRSARTRKQTTPEMSDWLPRTESTSRGSTTFQVAALCRTVAPVAEGRRLSFSCAAGRTTVLASFATRGRRRCARSAPGRVDFLAPLPSLAEPSGTGLARRYECAGLRKTAAIAARTSTSHSMTGLALPVSEDLEELAPRRDRWPPGGGGRRP